MVDSFYLHLSKVNADIAWWESLCNAVVSYGTKEGLTANQGEILTSLGHIICVKNSSLSVILGELNSILFSWNIAFILPDGLLVGQGRHTNK